MLIYHGLSSFTPIKAAIIMDNLVIVHIEILIPSALPILIYLHWILDWIPIYLLLAGIMIDCVVSSSLWWITKNKAMIVISKTQHRVPFFAYSLLCDYTAIYCEAWLDRDITDQTSQVKRAMLKGATSWEKLPFIQHMVCLFHFHLPIFWKKLLYHIASLQKIVIYHGSNIISWYNYFKWKYITF